MSGSRCAQPMHGFSLSLRLGRAWFSTVHKTRKLALETSRAVIPSAIVLLYKCFIEGLDSARPALAYGSCQGSPLTSSQRKIPSPAYQMIRSSFRISVHIRMENGCAGVTKPVSHVCLTNLTIATDEPFQQRALGSWGGGRTHYLSFGVGREIKKGIYLRSGPIAIRMRNETLVISVGRSI